MSIFTASRQELPRVLLHVPVGIIGGFLYFAHPVFPLVFLGLFVVYEVNEDWHLRDGAWKDIKGAIWGVGLVGVVVGILKLAGVI